MSRRRLKDEITEIKIKDWHLEEEFRNGHFYLEIPAVLRIYSEVSAEECRQLLRAIVNNWIRFQLVKNRVNVKDPELVKRERKLLINYHKKAHWEWGWSLQPIANMYQQYEGRPQHKAVLCIMGNVWKFESGLELGRY